jgi:hypothetical protein
MVNKGRNTFAQNQSLLAEKPPFLPKKLDFPAVFGPFFHAVNPLCLYSPEPRSVKKE